MLKNNNNVIKYYSVLVLVPLVYLFLSADSREEKENV